ncbi:hypothetical protein [Helicobacter canis]|uniref:Uncharacterized protein n=1 Tax=Helicobacter canis TaxID=29419 RepID=A0A377J1L5_9HELI|nr:hypothetical protein [Helicobacter canis]STO96195.1 Uncharacterised protein [Helicobacter canis]STO96260.1 Uncharacterised protein [Helicobacter canis]
MAIAAASLHSLPLKVNPLTRLAKPHFYLQNPTPSDFRENYRTPFLSLRGSEATEAIHKKVDSRKNQKQRIRV